MSDIAVEPNRDTAARRLGAWLVIAVVALYLGLVTSSHSLVGVPLPLVGVAAIPLVVMGAAAVRARIDGRSALALPGPVEVLAAVAAVAVLLNDLVLFQSPALRDLALYVRAGWFANLHLPVYLNAPMTYLPSDPTLLPFLYPPFTLPIFGTLARLPWPLVATCWIMFSVAVAATALRLFGLSWRWAFLFLLWPPFAEGLYVGNVAVPALLLFAAGIRAGTTLPLGAVFKLQAGIPALWLVREQRVRELLVGAAVLVALVAATLPATGLHRWQEWLAGLIAFRDSEIRFPALAGQSLSELLPGVAWLALIAVAIVLAWRARAREGLTRIGVAAIVASPSLYSHGFLVGLPAFLALNRFWFWVAIACTASVWGYGWWAAIAIAVVAWRVPAMNHRMEPNESLHPLRGSVRVWRRPIDWQGIPVPSGTDRKVTQDA